MLSEKNSKHFMDIAMKYIPEAKAKMDEAGIPFSVDLIQPFLSIFTKVMSEGYELGRKDAANQDK